MVNNTNTCSPMWLDSWTISKTVPLRSLFMFLRGFQRIADRRPSCSNLFNHPCCYLGQCEVCTHVYCIETHNGNAFRHIVTRSFRNDTSSNWNEKGFTNTANTRQADVPTANTTSDFTPWLSLPPPTCY